MILEELRSDYGAMAVELFVHLVLTSSHDDEFYLFYDWDSEALGTGIFDAGYQRASFLRDESITILFKCRGGTDLPHLREDLIRLVAESWWRRQADLLVINRHGELSGYQTYCDGPTPNFDFELQFGMVDPWETDCEIDLAADWLACEPWPLIESETCIGFRWSSSPWLPEGAAVADDLACRANS